MAAAHNPQLITTMTTTMPFSSRAIRNRPMTAIPYKRANGSPTGCREKKTRGAPREMQGTCILATPCQRKVLFKSLYFKQLESITPCPARQIAPFDLHRVRPGRACSCCQRVREGVATPVGLEPTTSSLEGWRSIQLSYGVAGLSEFNMSTFHSCTAVRPLQKSANA